MHHAPAATYGRIHAMLMIHAVHPAVGATVACVHRNSWFRLPTHRNLVDGTVSALRMALRLVNLFGLGPADAPRCRQLNLNDQSVAKDAHHSPPSHIEPAENRVHGPSTSGQRGNHFVNAVIGWIVKCR